MKLFVVLVAVCGALLCGANAQKSYGEKSCYNNIVDFCKSSAGKDQADCTAKYSGFKHHEHRLQGYANLFLDKSFEYLLLGSNFNQYKKDRPGFRKIFTELSDNAWNSAIDVIKYITKRGGTHDFTKESTVCVLKSNNVEVNEISSLGIALDVEKDMATCAHELHEHALIDKHFDTEVAHYLEEKFVTEQSETIRNLAGHISDLKKIVAHPGTVSLGIYLFDQYLQK